MVFSFKSSSKKVWKVCHERRGYCDAGNTYQAVVERCRNLLEVEPDVESTGGWDVDFETHILEALEDMITLGLEVLLEGDLFDVLETIYPLQSKCNKPSL